LRTSKSSSQAASQNLVPAKRPSALVKRTAHRTNKRQSPGCLLLFLLGI
jgi:hypothetical protein